MIASAAMAPEASQSAKSCRAASARRTFLPRSVFATHPSFLPFLIPLPRKAPEMARVSVLSVFLALCLFGFYSPSRSQVSVVTLTGDANWVVSDDDMAVLAFNMTLLDVERDFYKVLGYPPLYVSVNSSVDPLLAGDQITSVFLGTPANAPYLSSMLDISTCLGGAESHCVRLVKDPRDPSGDHMAIVAIGADMRGAIYAAFSLSELILGVDPWYRFSNIQPDYRASVELESHFNATFASPAFEYRAVFTNDEDLLGGFTPDPMGESVFSVTTFDWLYETTLRLKANAFLVGTVPYPDEKSLTLASRRGLVVGDHHFNLLGLNTFRWPGDMKNDWDWQHQPATMAYAWQASAWAMSRLDDVVWSVGYRGLNDYAAPCTGCSDALKGQLISEVIANQTQWIAAFNPGKPQKYITYLWQEGLRYLSHKELVVPEEVSIILTDAGVGEIGGLSEYANISDGVYTHVAMLNGRANQLTEMVSPSRHFEQLGEFVKTGRKTKYIILNTSDMRPVPLSTEGVFRFAWDPKLFMSAESPEAAQESYIRYWCARQYAVNESIAADIAALYGAYFQIPYINKGTSDTLLANNIIGLASQYADALSKEGKVSAELVEKAKSSIPQSLADVQQLYQNSTKLFARIQPILTQDRANFFTAHILTQQGMQCYACQIQNALAQSIIALSQGNAPDANSQLQAAFTFYENFFAVQRSGETSNWRGLFMHSRLSDFHRGHTYVRRAMAALMKPKTSVLPPARPSAYYTFTYYQFAHQPNFPLFYPNEQWNMDNFVRVYCSNNDSCWNNATGGFFHQTAVISMALLRSDASIHYTLDGSVPSASSPTYSKALTASETTTVKACAVVAGKVQAVLTEATFYKTG